MKTILFVTLALLLVAYSSAYESSSTQNLMSHIDMNSLCKNWDKTKSQCIECYEGCTKWENICVYIVKHCAKWNDMGGCVQCEQGYGSDTGMSINGTCPKNPNTTLTSPGMGNETDMNCQCHNDDKICIDCYAGYYLDLDSFCTDLPEYCTAADEFGNCTACRTGYVVENGTCVPQECDLSLCAKFNADQTKCLQCPNRSYLQDGCCLEVNGYCEKWIPENGVCLSCYVGYKLNKNDNKSCILDTPQ